MKTLWIVLFSTPIMLEAQTFSTYLYFESANGYRDSVLIGYDLEATAGIDLQFGEEDLKLNSLEDSIDIRMALPDYSKLECFSVEWQDYYMPDLILHESKIDVIPKECDRFVLDSATNELVFFQTILIPFSAYPLTMSWDSTVFQNECVDEAFFTTWFPGGWFDAGCPWGDILPVKFIDQNSFELTEPIGMSIFNQDLEALSMLFLSLKSSLKTLIQEEIRMAKKSKYISKPNHQQSFYPN